MRIFLILIVFFIAIFLVYIFLKKRKGEEAEQEIEVDDKTYTLELLKSTYMILDFQKKN